MLSLLDINECAVMNGGCSQFCHNLDGTYRCECIDAELCQPGFAIIEETDQCVGEFLSFSAFAQE